MFPESPCGEAGGNFGPKHALHSRYNPQGEAEKYLNSLDLPPGIRFFILIEPGQEYLIPLLYQKFPAARIIALHVQASNTPRVAQEIPVIRWNPEAGIPLQAFLEQEIPDTLAAAIRIIEWRPALAAYGERYRWLLKETVDFIKRIDANTRTTRTFGRRWFRNFFKNLMLIQRVLVLDSAASVPVIITAAGPSLEEAAPRIKALQRQSPHWILAVSSSVQALRWRNILPDLVITTDGGGWACFHLYECLRGMDTQASLALAASLSAALPSQCRHVALLPISDGSLWQTLILQGLGIPYISLAQRGTVSASALDLALVLTQGRIYLAGMDLAHQDIRTHARPYGFDRFLEAGASRLNPVYTQSFTRSQAILAGGSHDIYAAWFRQHLQTYPERIYTLGSNNPVFKTLKPGTPPHQSGQPPVMRTWEIPWQDNPVKQGGALLVKALAAPHTGTKLYGELVSLLAFDESEAHTAETLSALILNLIEPYEKGRARKEASKDG
ncbi:MAG: DUF115 domain-containing protein [Treponema sp.]|jgi:hypothetical protein|nr:DUF115 domain-containing protein [Treponema sp.]